MDFNAIKKNIKKDYSAYKTVRVALLGDSSTQLFGIALRGYAFEKKVNLEIFESDYDQVERQIFDTSSELYDFNPDYVLIFQSTQKLKQQFYKRPKEDVQEFAQNHLEFVEKACTVIMSHLQAKIVYLNFNEIDDREFGNYSNKTARSFLYQLRKINFGLMDLSQGIAGLFICDLCYLVAQAGGNEVVDDRFYVNADILFKPDFYVVIAKNILDIISAAMGRVTKCLILDLDNTLWGGIIGDDGIENIQIGDFKMGKAFLQLQYLAKRLKDRGIILAICSKNTESIAKEPFEKHPDMVLRLEDITVFVANWENKVDNIKYIQEVLDIGFDSMIFLDDNPFERDMVKRHIPEIIVPVLPDDPALYLNYLRNENLFETTSFSEADENRTKLYQVEANRRQYKNSFINENEFLKNLEMECDVEAFNSFNIPRVAQLTQRSNQFNLRTIRYSESDLQKIVSSEKYFTLAFSLRDKFGEHGLVSSVILENRGNGSLFINTWIMSCRVLKRNVEKFVLNEIIRIAGENGLKIIVGEYIPTPKNALVKELYGQLGFTYRESLWCLDVESPSEGEIFIKKSIYDNRRNN